MLNQKVFGVFVLIALSICIGVAFFSSGGYLSAGNLHDVFIPYLSSLAVDHGMVLHRDIHSPFGWIYFRLNFFSALLIKHSFFSFNDLIPLGSLLWALLVVLFWFGVLAWGGVEHHIRVETRVAVAIFLALMVFNFRGDQRLSIFVNTWYGAYNNHLWGVIFLQMAIMCVYSANEVSLKGVRVLGVVQAVLAYVCIHYKISFGFGSVLLASMPILFDWRRGFAAEYVRWGLCCGVGLFGLTDLAGYSYGGYVKDLADAAAAKSEHIVVINKNAALMGVLLFLSGILCILRASGARSMWFCQWGVACLSLYLCVVGDFATPVINFSCALGLVALLVPEVTVLSRMAKVLAGFGVGGLVVIALINLGSLVYVSVSKMGWLNTQGVSDFYYQTSNGALIWRASDDKSLMFGLISSVPKGRHMHPLEQRIFWAYPKFEDLKMRSLSATNADYMDGLRIIQDRLLARGPEERRSVIYLEFINPLPVLVGSDMVNGAPHWVHFGTTTPFSVDDRTLRQMITSSREVVIPLASVDKWRQPFLNCKFLILNETEKLGYVLTDSDSHHLYYRRQPVGIAATPHPMLALVLDNCHGIVDAGISGALRWPLL